MPSHPERIRLSQLHPDELEHGEVDLIEHGKSYPVRSPDLAFSAAACAPSGVRGRERASLRTFGNRFSWSARFFTTVTSDLG